MLNVPFPVELQLKLNLTYLAWVEYIQFTFLGTYLGMLE